MRKGFTLIELLIIVTILATLGLITTLVYTGNLLHVRDTARKSHLISISEAMHTRVLNQNTLPLPFQSIQVRSGLEVIGYQGTLSEGLLLSLYYSKAPHDPKTSLPYGYYIDKSGQYFQLMAMGESGITASFLPGITKSYASSQDYSTYFPMVEGNNLGILVGGDGSDLNRPINEISDIKLSGFIDISTTNTLLKSYISNDSILTGDSSVLNILPYIVNVGGKIESSCKAYIIAKNSLYRKDGIYAINPTGDSILSVYCDMSTQGGGWTLAMKVPLSASYINNNNLNIEDLTNISLGDSLSKWSDSTINTLRSSSDEKQYSFLRVEPHNSSDLILSSDIDFDSTTFPQNWKHFENGAWTAFPGSLTNGNFRVWVK